MLQEVAVVARAANCRVESREHQFVSTQTIFEAEIAKTGAENSPRRRGASVCVHLAAAGAIKICCAPRQ
jgi:hypothetical protein